MSDMTLREKIARAMDPSIWVDGFNPLDPKSKNHWAITAREKTLVTADRILALIQADHAIVPKVPTTEMLSAGRNVVYQSKKYHLGFFAPIWTALLSAAHKVQP